MTRHNADAKSDRAKLNKAESSVRFQILASYSKCGAAEYTDDFTC